MATAAMKDAPYLAEQPRVKSACCFVFTLVPIVLIPFRTATLGVLLAVQAIAARTNQAHLFAKSGLRALMGSFATPLPGSVGSKEGSRASRERAGEFDRGRGRCGWGSRGTKRGRGRARGRGQRGGIATASSGGPTRLPGSLETQ